MPPDAKEALTRKLGPLPAWGWGVAIGGAILVARLFRKPSAGASNASPATTTIGSGPSTVTGTGPDATPTDVFSGANSLVQQLQGQVTDLTTQLTTEQGQVTGLATQLTTEQGQIAGLSGTIATLTNFQQLQTKLSALMDQRASTLFYINKWLTNKNAAQDALSKCRTASCKSTQNAAIKTADTNIANYTKTLTTLNASITDLQKQLNTVGTTT